MDLEGTKSNLSLNHLLEISWPNWTSLLFLNFFFFFLLPHLRHMEVPRLGVMLELQLPAFTRAKARLDLSHVCN